MIETKTNEKILKIFLISFTIIGCIYGIIKSTNAATSPANGNWKDTLLEFKGSKDTEYWGIATEDRSKTNATSAYAYNDKSNVSFTKVSVVSPSYTVPSVWDDFTYGAHKRLPIGAAYYLPNLVYEKGRRVCSLEFEHNWKAGVYIHVWWSPDSI